MRAARLVLRAALVGALIGVLMGVLEAARLYFVPREPLLEPDVRYVIWFLAPLIDLGVGGLLGLALGLVAAGLWIDPRVGKWVARVLGLAGVYLLMGALVLFMEMRHGRLHLPHFWVWSGALLAFLAWTAYYWRRNLWGFLENERHPYQRPAGLALLASLTVLLLGVSVFEFEPDGAAPSVKASSPAPVGKPNIVLITLDTVRADHLSLYGYSRPTTPNLDRWAQEGVAFDNAIASSSWTLASHASMFTGLLPHQHGANWGSTVDTGRWTLAEVLRAYGYDTAGFISNSFYGQTGWGMGQGFQVYEDASASARYNLGLTLAGVLLLDPIHYDVVQPNRFGRISASDVNREAQRWLQHHSGRPFFLFMNYFDAHAEYLPPAPFDRRFGRLSNDLVKKADPIFDKGDNASSLSEQERKSLIAGYDNCLAYMDQELDRFLQFLATEPEWSNTVVIITSDHGEAFGEHGFYGHGNDLHRETVHVPLIMFGPGIPAGLRIPQVAGTRRIFSTVLDLTLGIKQPFYSNSLRRYWEPDFKPGPFDATVISELAARKEGFANCISLATSEWRYIQDSQGHKELYRLTDAGEQVNLAGAYPEQAQALERDLEERIGSSLGPWVEPQYLLALVPAGSSRTRSSAFSLKSDLKPDPWRRVGTAQAYFPPQSSQYGERRQVENEDLLHSLPYQ
jgi:arylsulfatase A-like enzyme